jgi:hypothetical protein
MRRQSSTDFHSTKFQAANIRQRAFFSADATLLSSPSHEENVAVRFSHGRAHARAFFRRRHTGDSLWVWCWCGVLRMCGARAISTHTHTNTHTHHATPLAAVRSTLRGFLLEKIWVVAKLSNLSGSSSRLCFWVFALVRFLAQQAHSVSTFLQKFSPAAHTHLVHDTGFPGDVPHDVLPSTYYVHPSIPITHMKKHTTIRIALTPSRTPLQLSPIAYTHTTTNKRAKIKLIPQSHL